MGLVHQYPNKPAVPTKSKSMEQIFTYCDAKDLRTLLCNTRPWRQLTYTHNPSFTHQHSNGHLDWPIGCTNSLPNQQPNAINSTPNTPTTSYPIILMGIQITGPHPSPNLDPNLYQHLNTGKQITISSNAVMNPNRDSSFAWLIATNQPLWQGEGAIPPGPVEDVHTGRSEAYGILTALRFLAHYLQHFLLIYYLGWLQCVCRNCPHNTESSPSMSPISPHQKTPR